MMSHDRWLVDSMGAIDFVTLNDSWTLLECEDYLGRDQVLPIRNGVETNVR